ncbi:hypothetical protein Ahy_B09g098818 [Arachis hypogaea]|uniref:Uncharacterized protein n=1 Tax=Arachis hypogaea TaxID=3818 RepID=A0A444XT10_ARAHY|nr:hypothetical protein Ahy_B09g098818 [Arachis hypogaea]
MMQIKENVQSLHSALRRRKFLFKEDKEEVIAMNMSVFQFLLSFLAAPPSKSKATKWMNKLINKGREFE